MAIQHEPRSISHACRNRGDEETARSTQHGAQHIENLERVLRMCAAELPASLSHLVAEIETVLKPNKS